MQQYERDLAVFKSTQGRPSAAPAAPKAPPVAKWNPKTNKWE
jgi:hypothetical protein